jgi:hypothetical protein
MNYSVTHVVIAFDHEFERWSVIWQGEALCIADAWRMFLSSEPELEDGDKAMMLDVVYGDVSARYCKVQTTIELEG